MKTNKRTELEREMRQIFKELSTSQEKLNETVRDTMRAYSLVKQENQQRSNSI